MGMKYLETLKLKDAAYELNSLNFHRLVLTAVLVRIYARSASSNASMILSGWL
jgi:hypothetical protein